MPSGRPIDDYRQGDLESVVRWVKSDGRSGQTLNSYRKRYNSYNLAAEAQRLSVESTRLSRLSIADRNTCDLGCHSARQAVDQMSKTALTSHQLYSTMCIVRACPPALARTLPGIAVKAGRVVIRLGLTTPKSNVARFSRRSTCFAKRNARRTWPRRHSRRDRRGPLSRVLAPEQTRARYFFFVPWTVRRYTEGRGKMSDAARKIRAEELGLIDILADSETPRPRGIIGIEARTSLQRCPSSIYWNGLKALRICTSPYSLGDYIRYAERSKNSPQALLDDDRNVVSGGLSVWPGNLPNAPDNFPNGVRIGLTAEEAGFLKQQVIAQRPDSLFAFFVREGVAETKAPFAWDQPEIQIRVDIASGESEPRARLCRSHGGRAHHLQPRADTDGACACGLGRELRGPFRRMVRLDGRAPARDRRFRAR